MNLQTRARAIELIQNPPPGSKLAAAKEYGLDLTLLLENLGRTPTERAKNLCAAARSYRELQRAGERARSKR